MDLPIENGDLPIVLDNKVNNWLVVLTILKNMKVNGKDDIPYIMENKKCLKPPTILYIYIHSY